MTVPKQKPPLSVPYLTDDRIQALRELLPEAFSEGKIDFEKLRAALGDSVEDSPESYSFSWAGKRDALRLLQTPTRAPPVRLTRKTLLDIVRALPERSQKEMIENPQEFAVETVRAIKARLADQLVEGIRYQKLNEWYEMSQLDTEIESWQAHDEHGEPSGEPLLYLVAETKSTQERDDLRPDEARKIQCGAHHFREALGVRYEVVTKARDIRT